LRSAESRSLIGADEQRASFSELSLWFLTCPIGVLRIGAALRLTPRKETLMTTASTLDSKETVSLIGSDKVEGTAVYGADDKKIGKLERVMIDKISGKVAHAVLSFGGFMGMGEDYYPVPWSMLKYDTNLGGYRVKLTKDQLDKAPKYSKSTDWDWNRDNDRRVYDYYKAPPYWGV
jgi:PRC-barrel domain